MNKKSNIECDVQLAKRGDREAFSRLIHACERNLYGLARLYLKREEDCADAVQEAIYKSFIAIPTLKEPAYFKTWLSRILIHECLQLLRSQQRLRKVDPTDGGADALPYEAIELNEAVTYLEEDLRRVIQLHYYRDMPISHIAKIVGIPEGTVKSRLYRARAILAERLDPSTERNVSHDPIVGKESSRNDFAPIIITIRTARFVGDYDIIYRSWGVAA
ncbi:sigma-70 family RNA polymerase sigma factor [Virgibacillus sp. LDC1]|uniref:sigma-70 family RNA polymerase sigma factor n=1 Tax=Paenibacillus lautus TaxID=1401 RepID=UPI002DBFF41D|nr:sigma-70 family RNA polymerase sigma factor [Paenibacillus lautus]MCV4234382.1 sigma-70 family RNA polymerase sigma factor [Virgibacillus sp. LDC1]MEC0305806.1 sigma-70 family RNA polymerase sigma factor [Paenibacillus lautus]